MHAIRFYCDTMAKKRVVLSKGTLFQQTIIPFSKACMGHKFLLLLLCQPISRGTAFVKLCRVIKNCCGGIALTQKIQFCLQDLIICNY